MITLSLRALSLYGRKIANSLRASEEALNKHCSCPPGQSCTVEVTELPGRRFEVIVTRPAPVVERHDWSVLTSKVSGTYRRLFVKRASMDRIRDAVAWMVGAPLHNSQVSSEIPPDQRNIVLIDSNAMKEVSKRILGCETCSPFAEIPVSSILAGFHRSSGPDTYYMLETRPKCPRCSRAVTEGTLVEVEAEP